LSSTNSRCSDTIAQRASLASSTGFSQLETSALAQHSPGKVIRISLGADVKRVLLIFVSCAAIFQGGVMPDVLGQNTNSTADLRPAGNRFRVDHAFNGADGGVPTAALIQDTAGNLYGTTSSGGSGLGVVFKLDTANNETVLHAFSGPDGATPYGGLVLDGSGNLYGTTSAGGSSGLGTVFKIDTSGTETVLHSFAGNGDGASPYAGLVMDNSGNLFGTTEGGGAYGLGTVFKVDTTGSETVLHSFGGGSGDGGDPKAGVILDAPGNLYGTTFSGGSAGKGTVFKLDTTNAETVLYNFTGGRDGANPFGGLTRGQDGTLYGTAETGGRRSFSQYGCCKGVVFSLSGTASPSIEKVLHTFTGGKDGGDPAAGLVLYNGALYGTTLSGGPGHRGTAFSITIANGQETVLHGFTGKGDGASPHAGLLINTAGVIYGTAAKGGRFKAGTVFQYGKR
jgi:uncharacterized repeat protein (TIGR03803 family)